MKKTQLKDVIPILLLLAIVIFAFKGYNSTDSIKDVTKKFPEVKELKKELNKKYSFINKDDIEITIKKI